MEPLIPQVFISSTSEFAAERSELARALRTIPGEPFEPFDYQEETARGVSPERHCRDMIRKSQIVCLILGEQYGSTFPGRDESIVQWEFEQARACGDVDVQVHVKDVPLTNIQPRQAAFIERVRNFRSGTWCRMFVTPPQLVRNAVESARKCRREIIAQMREARQRLQRWKDTLVMTMQIAIVAIGIAAFAWAFAKGVSSDRLLLLLVAIALTEVCLWPLLKYQFWKELQHE